MGVVMYRLKSPKGPETEISKNTKCMFSHTQEHRLGVADIEKADGHAGLEGLSRFDSWSQHQGRRDALSYPFWIGNGEAIVGQVPQKRIALFGA